MAASGLLEYAQAASAVFEYEVAPATTLDPMFRKSFADQILCNDLINSAITHFLNCELLPAKFIFEVLNCVVEHNRRFPNVVAVKCNPDYDVANRRSARVVVVGDLHGQFLDLLAIIQDETVGGMPSAHNIYIFNGDMVDRGEMSVETVLTIFLMQVVHPGVVYVTRGNHETVLMTAKYGFQKEVELKYNDVALLTRFHQAFCSLPVVVVVENAAFITHGGLGAKTHLMSIADLNKLDRFVEPHRKSELWELIWSGTYSCFTLDTLHCTDCVA
jgi:hypothetical protein